MKTALQRTASTLFARSARALSTTNPSTVAMPSSPRSAIAFSPPSSRSYGTGLPIGDSHFGSIVRSGARFVDKTMMLEEFLEPNNKTQVSLVTRPRRFGKTLNLSMIQHFLSPNVLGLPTAELFDGLKITQKAPQLVKKHQGKHPTIMISFKDIKARNFDSACTMLSMLLADVARDHIYLLESPRLDPYQKINFSNILSERMPIDKLAFTLRQLSDLLYIHHAAKVFILIDEYDTPVMHAYMRDAEHEKMLDFMRTLFGSALKDNPYLERAMITGVLRLTRESLFSDLNNVRSYGMLSEGYAEYFGFTEREVWELFEPTDCKDQFSATKNWYNGYLFGGQIIYNPWSIVNCIEHGGDLRPYWVNTGNDQIIADRFRESPIQTRKELLALISGKPIRTLIDESVQLQLLNASDASLWTLLFMSGYLKGQVVERKGSAVLCDLSIPNREIMDAYQVLIHQWLAGEKHRTYEFNFYQDLLDLDMASFADRLHTMLTQVISYHDAGGRVGEAFYHGFLLGKVDLDPEAYDLKSNFESGYGRFDIAIIPKDTSQIGIILELKSVKRGSDKNPEELLLKSACEALQQIEENEYDAHFKQLGIEQVLKVGIAFSGKRLAIQDNAEELLTHTTQFTL